MRFCMLLSRACPQKIPPWIFCGIGDLQANLRVAKTRIRALLYANQERGGESHFQTFLFFQERNSAKEEKSGLVWWDAGKKQGVGTATKKSVHGFFCGLQNRYAILHVTKSPSMALYCLARKKSLSCFFYTDVKKLGFLGASP